jgi:hypothetical protein
VFPPTPQNPSKIFAFDSPKTSLTLPAVCLAIFSGVTEYQPSSSILMPLSYFEKR